MSLARLSSFTLDGVAARRSAVRRGIAGRVPARRLARRYVAVGDALSDAGAMRCCGVRGVPSRCDGTGRFADRGAPSGDGAGRCFALRRDPSGSGAASCSVLRAPFGSGAGPWFVAAGATARLPVERAIAAVSSSGRGRR